MKQLTILILCVLVFAGQAQSANNSLFFQSAVKGTYTDNVFLSPTASNDFITAGYLWARQPLKSTPDASLRLKADLKTFWWANNSFDNYTYSLFGADYRQDLKTGGKLRLGYGYVSNDSYDFEAPFHLFKGHELSADYQFPKVGKWSVEAGYAFGTRKWDSGASGRDGNGHAITSTFTTPIANDSELALHARWQKENTDDPAEEFSRYTAGLGITHYLRGNTNGPQVSADYRYKVRDYPNSTRRDVGNVYLLEVSTPAGRGTDISLRYASNNNSSTFAARTYNEHNVVFTLQRRF